MTCDTIKQGFTLLETIITIVIIGILIGVIFQVYVMVGRMALFINAQKAIHDESIYLVQTIQNLVDSQSIVLDGFDTVTDELKNGFDERLVLSDSTFSYIFTRECVTPVGEDEDCTLQLEIDDDDAGTTNDLIELTDPNKIYINNFYIRKLPYLAAGGGGSPEENYERTMHNGFWMFLDVRYPRYQPGARWVNAEQQYQMFFNIRKY